MDSKHRHQLEQNLLAQWISDLYEDWIRPNSSWLFYVLIAVLIVVGIVMFTARLNAQNQALAWKQYYAALHSEQSEDDLKVIAETTSGPVGAFARLALAQRQLTTGASQVFSDKNAAVTALENAAQSFKQIQSRETDPAVLQQSGIGLAQCWESLAAVRVGNDLAQAETEYQNVAERWSESFIGRQAQRQLTLLKQPATKKFFELAAARKTEPAALDDFKVNIDPSDPFSPGDVDTSSFEQTETAGQGNPASNETKPDGAVDDSAAVETDAEPASVQDEKPAEETPKTDAEPAAEKPAETPDQPKIE